ncbi:AraC family transcriptional regulator [Flammeovirgaceae bacterium SG7u.111]|nr:AraC family transcriptional regulator [Flammeovirgaceae bacterium SG7u.132]WPO33902.1 AraC family transcriptional regulator [Flammeovirgaceae bacterium SG7u.111]
MDANSRIPDKSDPSDELQEFPQYNIQLHCCRYWWLQNWEFSELSYPFWRIYHNSNEGAVVICNGKEYDLTPDRIVLIAPNTSYATRIHNHKIPKLGYSLKGGSVNLNLSKKRSDHVLHLFIHFNLGIPFDNIPSGIFIFDLTNYLKIKLKDIKHYMGYEHVSFSFHKTLTIHSLINDLLSQLPEGNWKTYTKDYRILQVLTYIENHVSEELSNTTLAEKTNLVTNAFARLFSEEIGMPPQKYIKKKRIDKARILLHHTHLSIDEIALKTGFADRYHFSRIFKQVTRISPAKYKKEIGMK